MVGRNGRTRIGTHRRASRIRVSSSSRKSRKSHFSIHRTCDANALFSLMLASLSKFQEEPNSHALTLIRKSLIRLRLSLCSAHCPLLTDQQTLPPSILSLIPVILNSRFVDIASLCAKVVGAASLRSFEMNQQIASDGHTIQSLLLALSTTSSKKLTAAVCASILDLCTSTIGRQRLLQFSALRILINCFLQGHNCSVESATVDNERMSTALKKEEEAPTLLLDAIITLVNSCNIKQLERISIQLLESFLGVLNDLWSKLHSQILVSDAASECNIQGSKCLKNCNINDLAECIFRLATVVPHATVYPIEVIKKGTFGLFESSFEKFLENHWEGSPFFMNTTPNDNRSFWSVLDPLHSKDTIPQSVTWLLQKMVACPPIASDELDILNYLKQEKDNLGIPIIYLQDIRVLKVEETLKEEIHFFPKRSGCNQVLSSHDITKCEEALQKGYTIALRGMEFRFKSIAAVTEGLASLFGQPSLGANLYLTPPNSQGLARHYDDHCVFVFQLIGTKQWAIYPPKVKLPRLYEPPIGTCMNSSDDGGMNILLKEGDMLYIPRGFIHEAHTVDMGVKQGCNGWSSHLTLAVEVEPPFEWEGFVHIALVCWAKKLKENLAVEEEEVVLPEYVGWLSCLLHMVIVLMGEADVVFRRACLVGSASSNMDDGFLQSQREIFYDLMSRISSSDESRLLVEVVARLEMGSQQNVDPLRRIRWLQNVEEDEEKDENNLNMCEIGAEDILGWFHSNNDREAVEKWVQVLKSKLCKEVMFDDVVQSYMRLLDKYKKVRMQYGNGMLSLHHIL